MELLDGLHFVVGSLDNFIWATPTYIANRLRVYRSSREDLVGYAAAAFSGALDGITNVHHLRSVARAEHVPILKTKGRVLPLDADSGPDILEKYSRRATMGLVTAAYGYVGYNLNALALTPIISNAVDLFISDLKADAKRKANRNIDGLIDY